VNATVREAIGGGAGSAGGLPALISLGIVPATRPPELFDDLEDPAPLPLIWEIATQGRGRFDTEYLTLEPVAGSDTTAGYTKAGTLELALPETRFLWVPSNDAMVNPGAGVGDAPPRIDDAERAARLVAWLRLRPRPGADVRSLKLAWAGINAVEVDQRVTLRGQVLGASTGQADQEFALPQGSADADTLLIDVEEPGRGWQPWRRVDDLGAISPDPFVARESAVYELDAAAGRLRLGDGVRGRVPDRGMRIRLREGRFGGGTAGNLPALSLTAISGTLIDGARPAPMKITQPLATEGGVDAETLPQAERRIPALLRHRDRAVTAQDHERLAFEVPAVAMGRVQVLPRFKPRDRRPDVPGVVSVMVLPDAPLPAVPGGANPRPDRPFLERVHSHLAARVPLATELYVIGCEYIALALAVGVALREGFARDTVVLEVKQALLRLLWPLPNATIATGWPLGQDVRERELEVEISRVAGVREVLGINMFGKGAGETGPAWALLPRAGDGTRRLTLADWQLPELLAVVVLVDDGRGGGGVVLPTTLGALPNPFAKATAVAVPVVPALC
jgi:predicted phage baseplate assembly protein